MKAKGRSQGIINYFSLCNANCCLFQLLNFPANDEEIGNMLDTFEWVFLPVSNVDGFSFTHEVRTVNITRIFNGGMKMQSRSNSRAFEINTYLIVVILN